MSEYIGEKMASEEAVLEFNHAIEMYEGNFSDLRIVLAGLSSPDHDEEEQRVWGRKVPIKQFYLQRSVDRLLLVTNVLRILSQRAPLATPALDTLAKSLLYKPYHDLPPNPPNEEQLVQAQDEAERIGAALHITVALAEDGTVMVDAAELAVRFNGNHRRILKAMLCLGATDWFPVPVRHFNVTSA